MGAGDVVEAMRINHPSASVRFVRETAPIGPYTLVLVEGVSPDEASSACEDAWSHALANIMGKIAVVAHDTEGSYWGLDRSHFVEPKATFEFKGPSRGHYEDRKDPLQAALLGSGQEIVRDSRIYLIHPAPPWGPAPQRHAVAAL